MALSGHLADFGIAAAFSQIATQQQSGRLRVTTATNRARIDFRYGSVVGSEVFGRPPERLFGQQLVRAEVITEMQLQQAVARQGLKHARLGDVLREMGAVREHDLQAIAQLQSAETVYEIFSWRLGSYEFTQDEPMPFDHPPIRAEALLLDGVSQAELWPIIHTKIGAYTGHVRIVTPLDAAQLNRTSQTDFNTLNPDGNIVPHRDIGAHERLVYDLVTADRTIQKLIDVSRLGEFATCRALLHLLDAGVIAIVAASTKSAMGVPQSWAVRSAAARAQLPVALAGVLLFFFMGLSGLGRVERAPAVASQFSPGALEASLGNAYVEYLEEAIAVYQAYYGVYPQTLDALVTADLLAAKGVTFPYGQPYHYAVSEHGYSLWRPWQP